ncbi:MAG TPA: hypothetical protein VGE14_03560 [Marmoricola sp.]
MEILLWLLPSVVMCCLAMAWITWVARDRPEREQTAAEQERFARAILSPTPGARPRPRPRERSTGVAVRRGAGDRATRRPA